MSTSDEIHAAIAAHGAWKDAFIQSIRSGQVDSLPPSVNDDHRCAFGAWLFGETVPARERRGAHFMKVRSLHAEIHRLAEDILKKARAGRRTEAKKLLESDKALEVFSTSLQLATLEWERNWGKAPAALRSKPKKAIAKKATAKKAGVKPKKASKPAKKKRPRH